MYILKVEACSIEVGGHYMTTTTNTGTYAFGTKKAAKTKLDKVHDDVILVADSYSGSAVILKETQTQLVMWSHYYMPTDDTEHYITTTLSIVEG